MGAVHYSRCTPAGLHLPPVQRTSEDPPMSFRSLVLVPLFLAAGLSACSPSVEDRLKDAQAALDANDPVKAQAAAEEALKDAAISKDAPKAWRFEQIRLEA